MGGYSPGDHLLQLLLFLACTVTSSSEPIVHLWPLGAITLAYDVIGGRDAVFPTLTQCMRIGSDRTDLGYAPLRLNGGSSSHVDVLVDFGFYKDTTFVLNIKPEQLGGTLFDYNATSRVCYNNRANCFWRFMAQMTSNGDVNVTVHGSLEHVTSHTFSVGITAGKWHGVYVGIDVYKMRVTVDVTLRKPSVPVERKVFDYGSASPAYNLATPGLLRFGADMNGASRFLGEVTCAAAIDGKDADYSAVDAACQEPVVRLSAPTCLVTADVIYAFPLYNDDAGYDVVHNVSMRQATSGRFLRVEADVTAVTQGSLLMDGSPLSTLDLSLDFASFQGDFTLAFYVKVDNSFFGTLAHAKTTDSSGSGIRSLKVYVTESNLIAEVYDVSSADVPCGKVTILKGYFTRPRGWRMVDVRRRGSWFAMSVGELLFNMLDTCRADETRPSISGSLRVGGLFEDGEEGFHGHVACLVMFGTALLNASDVKDQTLAACTFESVPANSASDSSIEHVQYGHASCLVKNHDVTHFQPMAEVSVVSLSACASECRKAPLCRSFTVSKVVGRGQRVSCRLFDHLTRRRLVAKGGTSYYAMTPCPSAGCP